MKKNNIMAIIFVFISMSIIKVVGIENIPFPIIVLALSSCMVVAFIIALKYNCSKIERTFLLVMTTLVTLIAIILITGIFIENKYPQISEKYKPIIVTVIPIIFVIFLMVVVANAVYKFGNNKSKKK
ncbi:hypothetical protein [Clostridium guangxiense]|uniref:hypothetical protein n=1 Tax=Clostridium guangxiense TaxID=1662055 RepID=UPI001E53AB38|nr:hypothetical protein [Clostridium guangxiense]MCD2349058.1 hypothetical protein [Clostridium guangxiense]